jgi:hypothetical protein
VLNSMLLMIVYHRPPAFGDRGMSVRESVPC